MKIIDSIKLNNSVSDVWDILRIPGNMPAWNFKCASCDSKETVQVGSTFEAIFKIRNNSKLITCEIIELNPSNRITTRYSGDMFGSKGGYVDETFILICIDTNKTKLRHEVNFTNSRLPFILKFFLWFFSIFGYKGGQSSLDGIRDLLD